MPDEEPEDEATVLEEDGSVVLPVAGAAAVVVLLSVVAGAVAMLVLLSFVEGAVAMLLLLSLEDGALVEGDEEVEAVVAALSSWRPQPASAAASATAVAASVSFFMGLSDGWR
ncbi:hypothetical protein [Ramlibacter alkalitolerans]